MPHWSDGLRYFIYNVHVYLVYKCKSINLNQKMTTTSTVSFLKKGILLFMFYLKFQKNATKIQSL